MQSSSAIRKVIITGANKGIGYSIIEGLLAGETPYNIVLTSRDPANGEKAAKTLREKYAQSQSTILVKQLDVTNSHSRQSFVDWVQKEFGPIDVLVNNAGINSWSQTKELRLSILNTNYFAPITLTESLIPSLTKDAKIINISSGLGLLAHQGEGSKKALSDSSLTEEKLEGLAKQLYEDYGQGKSSEIGFSDNAYFASKALLNAYTRWVLPKKISGDQQCFTCTPGHCRTDMGGQGAPRSSEQGADTPIYLIGLPWKFDGKLSGKYFDERQVSSF